MFGIDSDGDDGTWMFLCPLYPAVYFFIPLTFVVLCCAVVERACRSNSLSLSPLIWFNALKH